MSSAPTGTNAKKMHFNCNQTRPSGASALATSEDPRDLLAALDGNRQTRRLALKNIKKLMRNASTATTTEGGTHA